MYVFLAQSCPTFSTPWTVACQALLSMNSLGKNTGVGFHFLLQGLFPTQGSNLHLFVSCIDRWVLYQLSHREAIYKHKALNHCAVHLQLIGCAWCSVALAVSLCDPMDCSPTGSSVHGILQARILEWVAMPSSRGSS